MFPLMQIILFLIVKCEVVDILRKLYLLVNVDFNYLKKSCITQSSDFFNFFLVLNYLFLMRFVLIATEST